MDLTRARPGQRKAIEIALERLVAGEKFTSLICPTRYGKSDIIRCVAAEAWFQGFAPLTLALSPNDFLRDQLVVQDKMADWAQRYSIPLDRLKYGRLLSLPKRSINPNREFLLSTTIQLFSKNADIFGELIDHCWRVSGLPVLIFVDEAHTGSEDNTWGSSYQKIIENRPAQGIVTTAVAIRSDGKVIPGFGVQRDSQQHINIFKTRPHATDPEKITVEVYDAFKEEIQLVAHHETTFQEAWEENPSPLCQLDWFPFDVCLEDIAGIDLGPRMLSELSAGETRRWLNTIVRDSKTIRRGVQQAIEVFRNRRKIDHTIGLIIFCSNDRDTDKQTNAHARQIELAIQDEDPTFTIGIATSADGQGKAVMKDFANGKFDVLIVKQMASVGLDVPRLKVSLDLSSQRTVAGNIQRWNRITTLYGLFGFGVLISPCDILAKVIFDRFIVGEGGGKVITDLTLIDEYDKERKPKPPQSIYTVQDIAASDFYDSKQNEANSQFHETARKMFLAFPELQRLMSHAEVVTRVVAHGIPFASVPCRIGNDVDLDISGLRAEINRFAHDIVMHRLGGHYNQVSYQEQIRAVHNASKIKAGVSPEDVRIDKERDLEVLRRIRNAMFVMWNEAGLNKEIHADA